MNYKVYENGQITDMCVVNCESESQALETLKYHHGPKNFSVSPLTQTINVPTMFSSCIFDYKSLGISPIEEQVKTCTGHFKKAHRQERLAGIILYVVFALIALFLVNSHVLLVIYYLVTTAFFIKFLYDINKKYKKAAEEFSKEILTSQAEGHIKIDYEKFRQN
jgi:predicted nucleic acid-binding Zn ribbon protein